MEKLEEAMKSGSWLHGSFTSENFSTIRIVYIPLKIYEGGSRVFELFCVESQSTYFTECYRRAFVLHYNI